MIASNIHIIIIIIIINVGSINTCYLDIHLNR